ncbi:hypothetical protein [Pinirhizobacter soli]|uniref:hypothetical protein n=1 Tax=Pinirhizobacter soli TaxID=2786953 RepID=UPI002029F981|nr:hypothetical protein [Pinirhizobacter soli]
MKLDSLLPSADFKLGRFHHQCQIKTFEESLRPQMSAGKGFLSNLFKISQRAVTSAVSIVGKNPASTLVYALLASPLPGAHAKPFSPTTNSIAGAFEGCWDHHRHDDFSFAFSQARCLGELAGDICSDKEPGTSGRYNFGIGRNDFNDAKHQICIKLLGRAAGIGTTLPSGYKELPDIIEDIIRDVTANPGDRENISLFDAEGIIEDFGLRGEVDGDLIDSRDVADWVSRHKEELEYKDHEGRSYANPPTRIEFVHAADNRYKESGDIKDAETYKRVLQAISELNLRPYENSYYGELIGAISKKLGV